MGAPAWGPPALRLEQRLSAVHRPRQIALMTMLQRPVLELTEVVDTAVRDNPLLLRRPGSPCRVCGRHCASGLCTGCRDLRLVDAALAAPADWRQELLSALRVELPRELVAVGEAVVSCLDSDGLLLDLEPEAQRPAAAEALGQVLEVLREVGPPGIAAASRIGCVVQQARALVEAGRVPAYLVLLVTEHGEALASGDLDGPAAVLGVPRTDLVRALEVLRSCGSPAAYLDEARTRPAAPDVEYRLDRASGRLTARVVDADWFGLCLDEELWGSVGRDGRTWLRPFRLEALALMRTVDARSAVLQAVADVIGVRQRSYLLDGPAEHRPLSRTEVADELGVHPSTVARAVVGKLARCPGGRLVPLADCFGAATAMVAALRALLASHPAATDAELSRLLAGRGFRAARRTVTKYRHQVTAANRARHPRTAVR
jgi:RNA polymerase sigma-54 factor